MSNYKDRGIVKWAPFDALSSTQTILEDLIFKMNKKQKNYLSEDEFAEMNETIKKATSEKREVLIKYYNNGYTYTTYGTIKKTDSVKNIITLDTLEEILFDDIIDIKLTR